MRRKNKRGYGYKRYPDEYLYKKLGLYNNYRLEWMKTLRWAIIGKPCEGKLQARFDEGVLEIGQPLWNEVVACNETFVSGSVTTPVFYSTNTEDTEKKGIKREAEEKNFRDIKRKIKDKRGNKIWFFQKDVVLLFCCFW